MHNPFLIRHYCALLDMSSGAVLTIGTNVPAMIFLSECTPDTDLATEVQYPNYVKSFGLFFIPSMNPDEYPKWTWDYTDREFKKTGAPALTGELLARSRLAESKRIVFEKIANNLYRARSPVSTGIYLQELVYLEKKAQAATFKDSGYDEDLIMKYPYVAQYADFAGISLRQAAEDILLKARFDDDILLKTELLRLTHLKKVKEATDPDQLPAIYEEFIRNYYVNAKV